MKIIYCFIGVVLLATAANAQDSVKMVPSANAQLMAAKYVLKPDLAKKIFALPINEDTKTIQQFSLDNQGHYQKFSSGFYSYNLMLGKDKDLVQVFTKPNTAIATNSLLDKKALKFTFYVNYECTDKSHSPRHTAATLDAMKKIQKNQHCSGIQVLLSE